MSETIIPTYEGSGWPRWGICWHFDEDRQVSAIVYCPPMGPWDGVNLRAIPVAELMPRGVRLE